MTPAEARAKAHRAGAALADLARAMTPPEPTKTGPEK